MKSSLFVGFAVAVMMVGAPPGCGVSKSPVDASGGGAKGGVGGGAGSAGGGSGSAGAPGSGGAAGRDGAPAAGHGGGAAAAGQGGTADSAAGGRSLGGFSGDSPAGAAGALGGRAGAGGSGGQDLFPCGMEVLCTIGATRCTQGAQQVCQVDSNGCPFWGAAQGQPPSCEAPRVCLEATGRCECPGTAWWCGAPGAQVPGFTGDFCPTSGASTYATCRLMNGCYVATTGQPCPEGTKCRDAASRNLVAEGTACE